MPAGSRPAISQPSYRAEQLSTSCNIYPVLRKTRVLIILPRPQHQQRKTRLWAKKERRLQQCMLSSDTKGAVADELHNAPFLVAACATPPAKCRSELMIYPVRICTINWILGAQRCINSSSHHAVYAAVHLLSLTTVCASVFACACASLFVH